MPDQLPLFEDMRISAISLVTGRDFFMEIVAEVK